MKKQQRKRHKCLKWIWKDAEASFCERGREKKLPYEALKVYMDFDGLRDDIVQMLGGGCAGVNTRSFQNDMRSFSTKDDVPKLRIHLGYLAYDSREKEAIGEVSRTNCKHSI